MPVGSPAVLNDPLRYAAEAPEGAAEELGFLRLRYKAPGEAESQLMETPIPVGSGPAPEDARFAAAIAGFAQLLTGGRYLGDWSFAELYRDNELIGMGWNTMSIEGDACELIAG